MATELPCDVCQSNPTQLVITMAATGDTVGICARCVLPWAKKLDGEIKALERAVNGPAEADSGPVGGTDPDDVDTTPRRAPKASKRRQTVPSSETVEPAETAPAADE